MLKRTAVLLLLCLCMGLCAVMAEDGTVSSYPASTVTDMRPQGYVGCKIEGLIRNWALTALQANPNLIDAVALARVGKGLEDSPYTGLMADQNEYFGKHLTGLAALYRVSPSSELKAAGDELVDQLNAARGKDGYLGVRRITARLGAGTWDLWGHYHAIYGLLEWYKATGSTVSREMAIDAADYCIRCFSHAPTYAIGAEFANYAICHAYALLYQETGNESYLTEAERIIQYDWPRHGDWLRGALADKDFYQSDEPRWETLHSVLALGTLYEITGDETYFQALEQIWWSIVKTDRHNSGSFASYEKAVGHPYDNNGLETCASVAWSALTCEYLRLSRSAYAADELELTYYNTLLGALTDTMREVTYSTPMNGTRISTQRALDWAYNSGIPDFNCCQANACRALGNLSQWAAMTDAQAVYLNYYGSSEITCLTPKGQALTLCISGQYPLSGDICVTAQGLGAPEEFTLMLRIPSWSRECSASFAGETEAAQPGAYHSIHAVWENGDTVKLRLGMTVHYWKGESLFGTKASVYYGPILLALDERFAEQSIYSATVSMEASSAAQVEDGTDVGCMLLFHTADVRGNPLTLIDFASAGQQQSTYASWLYVDGDLRPLPFDRSGVPVWQNGLF